VRGVRINVSPIMPPQPGFSRTMIDRIRRLDERCAARGWHLDFLTPGWLTDELLPTLAGLACSHTIAHLGMFPARDGPQQPGFLRMLDLMNRGSRRTWAKFTGIYRMSQARGFDDVTPMAQALIAAAPDRIIWGSDYPHLSFADHVGSVELFNKLLEWAPDAADRRRILADNPQALFGF
jgi:predicted TIM-barrel fold metal-dependent hydrolase